MKKIILSIVTLLSAIGLHAQHNYDNQNTIYSLNGNVGITTTTPTARLHLNALERTALRLYRENRTDKYLSIWHGTGGAVIEPIRSDNSNGILYLGGYDTPTNVFFARRGGNVSIGTTDVQAKLHLNALERKAFRIYREDRTDKYLSIWHGTGGAVIEPIRSDNSTGVLYLGGYDTPTNVFFARQGGDVGIGTTNTRGYKLAVNGKIRAKEIVVEASPWPDFVFKSNYNLLPLKEVAKHIKTKGHLPNIPTENEVHQNGISLGTMNAKLLQKIEELTLYTIQQEDQLNSLQEALKTVQAELKDLKKQH
ncbi:hypothetical protein D1816_19465 [Aquimarina sp. AD10]|uniref:hypothetical protein n=1 Tax=Aquimarina TaxID=290174 RepID=UPI000E47ACF1|nr:MULTISPECIES: hypothetical protein [Aquimarina]AXT62449.1 hypothetical protein D1816_19465 [Aquimarina sp. AD10]RKM90356.1 hypothetical protein D7033_22915 [Aquimarina sp. AD10]